VAAFARCRKRRCGAPKGERALPSLPGEHFGSRLVVISKTQARKRVARTLLIFLIAGLDPASMDRDR
jgi:hypothetical protein